jgi:hypothetical protein
MKSNRPGAQQTDSTGVVSVDRGIILQASTNGLVKFRAFGRMHQSAVLPQLSMRGFRA